MLERDVVATVRAYVRRASGWEIKVLGGLGQRAGVPDVLCCIAGRFVAVECKIAPRKPTANQRAELAAIAVAGGVAIVAYSLEDVIAAVEPLLAVSGRPWQPKLMTEGVDDAEPG